MEAQPHDPEALPPKEDLTPLENQAIGWANIFYGILIAPATTLDVLANPLRYRADSKGVLGAISAVFLCALLEGFAQSCFDTQPLALSVSITFVSDLVTWIMLAVFLAVWARCLKRETKFSSALVVTGWAFVPLIFKAPLACYVLASKSTMVFLLVLPVIWFFILELIAYDSILKMGKARTLGIVVLLPPILFFACLFWLIFWTMAGVGQ